MKTVLASLALVFALAGSARAEVVPGGPRQAYDAANCAIYRPTWAEFDLPVDLPGIGLIGTLDFGPEAHIAYFLNQSGLTPDQLAVARAANHRYAGLLHLNGSYRDHRHLSPGWGSAPSIGYDQFYAAMSVVREPLPSEGGPLWPTANNQGYDFSGWETDAETRRLMQVATLMFKLSQRHAHSQDQLLRIEAFLRETPTCNGVPYPAE